MMAQRVVVYDVVAEPRRSNSGERLALKVDQRYRERKARDLKAFIPHLEAEVGVLEVSNQIILVQPSDRVVNLPPHQRAGSRHGLTHDKLFRGSRARQSGARMPVNVSPQGWIPVEFNAVMLNSAVGMMKPRA